MGAPTREFVPGRRLDAFDRYYAGRNKQRLIVPNHTFGPGDLPREFEANKVYLLDGRGRSAMEMEQAVDTLASRFAHADLSAASLGELR